MEQTALDWFYEKIKSHFEHDGDLLETLNFTLAIAKQKERDNLIQTNMKQPKITIKDAKRKGGKGYRVQSVAKNGEVLQSSQVLDTVANVRKHIEAMKDCWWSDSTVIQIHDLTKDQTFVKKGWAKTGIEKKSVPHKRSRDIAQLAKVMKTPKSK